MLTNKEQLYQCFWQSVKQRKFKAKKIGGRGGVKNLKTSRVNLSTSSRWLAVTLHKLQHR